MFKHVGYKHSIECSLGKVSIENRSDANVDALDARKPMIDKVDRPPLLGRTVGYEFAEARGWVEHAGGPAHPRVKVGCDLGPNGNARRLIDVSKAIAVDAVEVQGHVALPVSIAWWTGSRKC